VASSRPITQKQHDAYALAHARLGKDRFFPIDGVLHKQEGLDLSRFPSPQGSAPSAPAQAATSDSVISKVETGEPTKTDKVAFGNMQAAATTILQSLESYRGDIADSNRVSRAFPASDAKTRHTSILLELKELLNLGVLNGPDLEIMERMMIDPSSPQAALVDDEGYNRQIDMVVDFVERKLEAKRLSIQPGASSRAPVEKVKRRKWTATGIY
jgi:hypothetical protein